MGGGGDEEVAEDQDAEGRVGAQHVPCLGQGRAVCLPLRLAALDVRPGFGGQEVADAADADDLEGHHEHAEDEGHDRVPGDRVALPRQQRGQCAADQDAHGEDHHAEGEHTGPAVVADRHVGGRGEVRHLVGGEEGVGDDEPAGDPDGGGPRPVGDGARHREERDERRGEGAARRQEAQPVAPSGALPVGEGADEGVQDDVHGLRQQQRQSGQPGGHTEGVREEVQKQQAGDGHVDAHTGRAEGVAQQRGAGHVRSVAGVRGVPGDGGGRVSGGRGF